MLCVKIEQCGVGSLLGEGLSEKIKFEHKFHYQEGSSNG